MKHFDFFFNYALIYPENIEKENLLTISPCYEKLLFDDAYFIDIAGSENYTEEDKKDLLKVTKGVSESVAKLYKDFGNDVTDEQIIEDISKEKDLADLVKERINIGLFMREDIKRKRVILDYNTMIIPQIKIYDNGNVNYKFEDFVLNVSEMNYVPIDNKIEYQNLINNETKIMKTCGLTFDISNPMKVIAIELNNKPEISDECSDLKFNLITSFLTHLKKKYNDEEIRNIIMFNKKNIVEKIYVQMKNHFVPVSDNLTLFEEKVYSVSSRIFEHNYSVKTATQHKTLQESVEAKDLHQTIFYNFKKAMHLQYKFDSLPEVKFAIVCEKDEKVRKWLRPVSQQFNLYYNKNNRYIPDFVVETDEFMYLVEIKGEDMLEVPEVLAKRERASRYCEVVNVYADANNIKYWKHLFIPSKETSVTSSFGYLANKFEAQ